MSNDLLGRTGGENSPLDWVVDVNASGAFADMLMGCIAVFEDQGSCNQTAAPVSLGLEGSCSRGLVTFVGCALQ